jgi:hypothetical protein
LLRLAITLLARYLPVPRDFFNSRISDKATELILAAEVVPAAFAGGLTTQTVLRPSVFLRRGVQVRMEALLERDEFDPFEQLT